MIFKSEIHRPSSAKLWQIPHPAALPIACLLYTSDVYKRQVLDKGGKIIIPKTKIEAENKGYFAVLEDSEGNHVGIYEK